MGGGGEQRDPDALPLQMHNVTVQQFLHSSAFGGGGSSCHKNNGEKMRLGLCCVEEHFQAL